MTLRIGQSIQTRYVPREELAQWREQGWRFVDDEPAVLPAHHHRYALMWRECDAD